MITTAFSTLFGVGYVPIAPGTVASLIALLAAWVIPDQQKTEVVLMLSFVAYVLGVWSCGAHAAKTGVADPSECVIDEVAGQWLACAAAPHSLLGFCVAFVLFRLLDISKIWPVSLGERLAGGWGIMTDDMIAGAIAASVIAGLRWQGLI